MPDTTAQTVVAVPAAPQPRRAERSGEWSILRCSQPNEANEVDELRALARSGLLALTFKGADGDLRRRLSGAAIAVAAPVVFTRITRAHEHRRGHRACAVAIDRLAGWCLDRFYDDLEAVAEYLLTHASMPVRDVEAWLASRLQPATVDAHRRRRSVRGALQRPRLPGWLTRALADDPWLGRLAIEILVWVGVTSTAGTQLWPLDSWAELRGHVTGDWSGSDRQTVEREVERVLAVMRGKPTWYANYVERPLGAKTAPVAPKIVDRDSVAQDAPALALVEAYEAHDTRLIALAEEALAAIESRLAANGDLDASITSVVRDVFGEIDIASELAALPHGAPTADEQITALISDPDELARIVRVVRDILGPGPKIPGDY